MKKCIICNKFFTRLWHGYKCKQLNNPRFCSKSCATKHQRGNISKQSLEERIINLLKLNNRYTSTKEVITILKISSKTIVKFDLNISNLNEQLGFIRPTSKYRSKFE